MAFYMRTKRSQRDYARIKQSKLDSKFDTSVSYFWLHVMPDYFSKGKDWVRTLKLSSLESGDSNVTPYMVHLCNQVKRNSDNILEAEPVRFVLLASVEPDQNLQTSSWEVGEEKLSTCLRALQGQETSEDMLFGAIAIGTLVCFYQLEAKEQRVKAWPFARGLELKTDAVRINRILRDIVHKSSR